MSDAAKPSDGATAPVSIERDLLGAIGRSLQIREVIEPFLHAARKLLDLQSAHFFADPQLHVETGGDESFTELDLNVPRSAPIVDGLSFARALSVSQAPWRINQVGGARTLFVGMPQIGVVALRSTPHLRGAWIDDPPAPELLVAIAHLRESCALCLAHARALRALRTQLTAELGGAAQGDDALTGLPNRRTLQQRLRQALAAAIRHHHFGAVFFIDIDRFKTINDSMGHAAGDAVLLALSQRLAAAARDEDTLARLGGDEFILIAGNLGPTAELATRAAQVLASRLANDCRQPVDVRGASVPISASMGICIYPAQSAATEHDADSLDAYCENIIRFADTAMYRTKNHGRDGFEFFAPQMQANADRRLVLERELRLALPRAELSVHYQPIVTSFGTVIGAEALLRWNSAALGSVEPDEFIPVAEDSGLILGIGDWVIDEVCALVHTITTAERFVNFRYISVNVSPRQVKQPDFVARIRASIARAPIPASGLRLELTEHAAIDNIEDTIEKMSQLNALGVLMALDDFGTGYSSLSYLHRLPISTLKLDRTFVTSIAEHEENQAIVDATIAMAAHLGIECIPEGVEVEADLAYFRSRPVHTMQGFYFSEAIPATEFLDILASGSIGPMGDLVQQLRIDWPETSE